jgi:hypothetical protein
MRISKTKMGKRVKYQKKWVANTTTPLQSFRLLASSQL